KAKEVNVEANAGIFNSNIDIVTSSQALNQTLPEPELDLAFLQPLNAIHPPQISDIPPSPLIQILTQLLKYFR
ncbi:hypothetical protein A2U01_0061398, partial [Trifolium medium]|nr:hypothetical protein [Trifolium medium]